MALLDLFNLEIYVTALLLAILKLSVTQKSLLEKFGCCIHPILWLISSIGNTLIFAQTQPLLLLFDL